MKIAILGTENSHAWEFSKIINTDEKFKDIEIFGLYGYDPAANQKIVDAGYCNNVAEKPEDFLGKVDAVICTARHGNNHYEYTLPYIKAGLPCFIDKPFTIDLDKAEEMVAEAKKSGALLCGGSLLRYMEGLSDIREHIVENNDAVGGVIGAPINFWEEHGGFFFYSQHLIEMMITSFGEDIKSVYATCNETYATGKRVSFIANYDTFDVTGHYYNCNNYSCTLYTKTDVIHADAVANKYNLNKHFNDELAEFVEMVNTKKMPQTYERLVLPVIIMNAIYESYNTGKEVVIK